MNPNIPQTCNGEFGNPLVQGDEGGSRRAWPTLDWDPALLADPVSDPDRWNTEWRRMFMGFDPYLRYYFQSIAAYDDMDEVVSAIWRQAIRKIHTLRDRKSAIFWLIKIGRNWLRDKGKADIRRLTRQRGFVDTQLDSAGDWQDEVLRQVSEERLFHDTVDWHEFRRGFAQLSDMDQEFVVLLKVEGRSHNEIVVRLGLTSENASKARWQWIKRKLRRSLAPANPDMGP